MRKEIMGVTFDDVTLEEAVEMCIRDRDLLGLAFATRDKQEGMEAFLARRPPRFQDF